MWSDSFLSEMKEKSYQKHNSVQHGESVLAAFCIWKGVFLKYWKIPKPKY